MKPVYRSSRPKCCSAEIKLFLEIKTNTISLMNIGVATFQPHRHLSRNFNMSNDILPILETVQKTVENTADQALLTEPLRVKALERELDQLTRTNQMMDNVIASINSSANNIGVVLSTTESSNQLLDLWIKILSQTSYTNAILSDKTWKGMSKNEEEYQTQVRKLEDLQKRYNLEKQKREVEREALQEKKLSQERRLREREEALRRRVYGNSSTRSGAVHDPLSSSSRGKSSNSTSKAKSNR